MQAVRAGGSLRSRLATLVALAGLLPLALSTYLDLRDAEARQRQAMESLLAARGDEIAREIDDFHRGYRQAVSRLAMFPALHAACADGAGGTMAARELLATFPASDPSIRGVALIDARGRSLLATEPGMAGVDLSRWPHVQRALAGATVISDLYFGEPQNGETPSVAYLAPIAGTDGRTRCVVALWVRAAALQARVKSSNALAGPGSFAVVFDELGVRIAHTDSDDIVYHPAGALSAAEIDEMVAQRRFGAHTRAWLTDVRAFPAQFERARAAAPDVQPFLGFAQVNQSWNYGVARRFTNVPWTVFYMQPRAVLDAEQAALTRRKLALGAAMMVLAALAGLLFAATIRRPLAALAAATRALAGGDLAARVVAPGSGEIGALGEQFNRMAERIETQTHELEAARNELEQRVQQRTAELEAEVGARQRTEARLQAKLERLALLDQITRAIGERQDLPSIYRVVARSLQQHLPLEFCCICAGAPAAAVLEVLCLAADAPLAHALGLADGSTIAVDDNGLARCLGGALVYESELADLPFAFARRLVGAGLNALVAAPLVGERGVFGVLLAARRGAASFSSTECEFLRQLSAHVALAARQAQLYGALERAYEDLRLTQQAVMQQERLRALGQMASGIAHDINNALSPATLYVESLLEREHGLDERSRRQLESIGRAIDDVAATVARLREFYRRHDTEQVLQPLQLNELVPQVLELTRPRWQSMPQQLGVVIDATDELAPSLPRVAGAESELREALTNLVFNAVDAMPDGGRLVLRTGVEGAPPRRVFVEVADTGIGMDEATRRRCLEPFFTTKGERGTGLGLAMVYGAAQRHGADIEIDSQPGRGTTVRLLFAEPAAGIAAPGAGVPLHPARALRLLLVDDDALILRSLREALEADGHQVRSADGGAAGLAAFERDTFDAVVTDLGMPGLDGRQLAAAVKRLNPATPVILLTGWGQRLADETERPPFVDEVLSKPPKIGALRAALARALAAGAAR